MVLSDADIRREIFRGRIGIDSIVDDNIQIQPASVDLRLSNKFIDVDAGPEVFRANEIVLNPGKFILGSTIESVTLSSRFCAQVGGKSSLGRLGITIHQTAGFIDPGFSGAITLELHNASNTPTRLVAGAFICQIIFFQLRTPCKEPYGKNRGSSYLSPSGPEVSRLSGTSVSPPVKLSSMSLGHVPLRLPPGKIEKIESRKSIFKIDQRYVERGIYQDIINCCIEAEKIPNHTQLPRDVELLISRLRTIASRL